MAARQRGAALLMVLLLVIIIALVASLLLELSSLNLARTRNLQGRVQAQAHALGAEQLARAQVPVLATQSPALLPRWHARAQQQPLDGGLLHYQLRDASACFNLNAVVIGAPGQWQRSEAGSTQLLALLHALQVPGTRAEALVDSLVDWIDQDSVPSPHGAEDAHYQLRQPAYLSAGALLAGPSELLNLAGIDPALYQRLRPWLCTLPTAHPTPLNVNALSAEQAPLLVMLSGGSMSLADARQWLARRPARGWGSRQAFFAHPGLTRAAATPYLHDQVQLLPQLFELQVEVRLEAGQAQLTSLFQADGPSPARLLSRRWTLPE